MNLLVDTFLPILCFFLGLALLGQLFVLGNENTGGGPPVDGDARGLLQGPSVQFEGERRPFHVLTDERVENVRRCSQRTGIGRPAEATELRLNDTNLSLPGTGAPAEAYCTGIQDVNDELEELLDGFGGCGPRNSLRLFVILWLLVIVLLLLTIAPLGGDTNVECGAARQELVLVECSVRGRPGCPVDADAVTPRQGGFSGVAVLVLREGDGVEGQCALPDRQGIVTAQAAIEE